MAIPVNFKQRKMQRFGALKKIREPKIGVYKEITNYLLPFAGRYAQEERNRGNKNFNHIYDETGNWALRVLTAGLSAGMTNPALPWFRLTISDKDLSEFHSVKLWLTEVVELMRIVFAKSNIYRMLPVVYEELGGFATGAAYLMKDPKHGIWTKPLTAGEYCIATDARGVVNTLYREFNMSVEQIVGEFVRQPTGDMDWSKASVTIKNLYDMSKNLDSDIPVMHIVEPRPQEEREYGSDLSQNMPWRSTFMEMGNENDNVVLRDSGFKDFPIVAPRWLTRGGDDYGYGPGHEVLGSIKQLQQEQLRKGQAIDFMTLPPVQVPGDLKGKEVDNMPGGVTYHTSLSGQKIEALYNVKLDLGLLLEDIRDVRDRINRGFYVDLFLMISQDDRRIPPSAREISERHEEKLLMLGPVLERLHDELLSPLIDITFTYMLEAGVLPPPPPELENQDLTVEFVSVLAQAQRAAGLGSLDRLIGTVGALAQGSGDTSVWDKLDKDQIVDEYAERLGVDPGVIVADDKMVLIREERKKQQRAQQLAAAAKPAKDTASALKTMSQVEADSEGLPAAAEAMQQVLGRPA